MWLLDLLGSFSGIGTELGAFNLVVIAALGYLLRREYRRIKARVDPIYDRNVEEIVQEHDEMYEEFKYRERRDASAEHSFEDKELIAGMVEAILKEKK